MYSSEYVLFSISDKYDWSFSQGEIVMANVISRTQRDDEGCLIEQYSVDTNFYSELEWVINPDLSLVVEVPKYYWVVVTGSDEVVEMSPEEKGVVDEWRLGKAKAAAKLALAEQMTDYKLGRYSESDQLGLQIAYENSMRLRPNRKSFIAPFINWQDLVQDVLRQAQSLVEAAVTVEEVWAVTVDTAPLDASDPCISLAAAMLVADDLSLSNFLDANASVTDPVTGVSGPFDLMQLLLLRSDIYNDVQNPLYHAGKMPILGSGGFMVDHANRLGVLEAQVAALVARVAALEALVG
jgi:hypothetical protein